MTTPLEQLREACAKGTDVGDTIKRLTDAATIIEPTFPKSALRIRAAADLIESQQAELTAAQEKIAEQEATIKSLRNDLANPPGDVQERVLQMLGLAGAQEKIAELHRDINQLAREQAKKMLDNMQRRDALSWVAKNDHIKELERRIAELEKSRAAVIEELSEGMRPCPLCQGSAVGMEHPAHTHVYATFMPDYLGSYTIECPRCNLGLIADTEQEAKAAWNSRVRALSQPAQGGEK